jgi:hypothetical protein
VNGIGVFADARPAGPGNGGFRISRPSRNIFGGLTR